MEICNAVTIHGYHCTPLHVRPPSLGDLVLSRGTSCSGGASVIEEDGPIGSEWISAEAVVGKE